MSWQDLLLPDEQQEMVLPWLGGRKIHGRDRSWRICGGLPEEYGWYRFSVSGGRHAELAGSADPDPDFETGRIIIRGYVVGNRMISDDSRMIMDPERLAEQTMPLYLVEPGLDRFARAVAADNDGCLVYVRQEFPEGPEMEVQEAYQDRLESVAHISGVTPALDLAFRFISRQRMLAEERERRAEERRLEAERRREQQERLRRAMRDAGTGAGRRALARRDFSAAARAALAISGAQLLDARPAHVRSEMVVQYRFRQRRFECVVDRESLRVIDSGICLTDEYSGEKGDTYFTLESLPAVVGEAIDSGRLVVYRHV